MARLSNAKTFSAAYDFRKEIERADFPVYYIHGDDDFLSLESHLEVMEKAPNTRLKVIPNAGHLLWVDQPEVVTDLMEELIELLKSFTFIIMSNKNLLILV